MGAALSDNHVIEKPPSKSRQHSFQGYGNNKVEDDASFGEDFMYQNVAEDVLIEFLSYVPAEDLVLNCRLVCKQWKALIDAQSIWRRKCEREHVKLPTRKFMHLPKHHYRYIYWHAKTKIKNLVKNPCGENNFNDWKVTSNNGNFAIENPPQGADPVPAIVGSQSCFATTYTTCEKYQVIDLTKNPVHTYLLKHDLVKIKVGEWYCARFDCASEYELKVVLSDDQQYIDQFEFQYVEEQWLGKEWHLVIHEFDNVTSAHFVGFYHKGKDRQFWAGHYGSKMTGAFVELCIK